MRHPFLSYIVITLLGLFSWHHSDANNDSLLQLLHTQLPDTSRIAVLNQLARNLRNVDVNAAATYGQEAFDLSHKNLYSKGVAAAGDILGVIYLNQANYKKALYYLFTALRLNEIHGNEKAVAGNCNNIGSVYFHVNKYDQALAYYKRSLALKLRLGMKKEVSSTYINIGNIYMKQNNIEQCIHYYNKALDNARQNTDDYNISVALMNLGEAYIDKDDYTNARKYYLKANEINTERADIFHLSNCNYALGKIYLKTGDYRQAEYYLLKGLELARKGGGRSVELTAYKYLAELYEKKSDAMQALHYYKQFHALSDSIYNKESASQMSEMQAKYETERKDKQIELLNKDKAITETILSKEKVIRNFFIAGFILIAITAGMLTRNIFLKQRVNRILNEKNRQIEMHRSVIEQKNNELMNFNMELMKENVSTKYEILKTKINPHFLFNSLSTLSSLIIQDPGQAIDFVSRFARLYRNILDLENKQLITIENEMRFVNEYIFLQKMRFGDNLVFTAHIHKSHLEEFVPPFAVQLLIENAIKHNIISKEQQLILKVYSENDTIVVSNTLQLKEQHEDSTGIGQKNILDRYKMATKLLPEFKADEGRYMAYLPIIKTVVPA